jgi:hypothetical protein
MQQLIECLLAEIKRQGASGPGSPWVDGESDGNSISVDGELDLEALAKAILTHLGRSSSPMPRSS